MSLVCPNCQHNEPEGALFCSECASNLITTAGYFTSPLNKTKGGKNIHALKDDPPPPNEKNEYYMSLHIIRTGQLLPLLGQDEFVIGRKTEEQEIHPDIDLAPYDAYSLGVSRLHAKIIIVDNIMFIEDLKSSNGTKINSKKIPALNRFQLFHGDVIALGRFKIQALIQNE